MINVIDTAIEGVKIIEPKLFGDARGYFFESFSQREFEEKVCKTVFVQDNESQSVAGVVRGLHFQKPPFTQAKLVRVVKGGSWNDRAYWMQSGTRRFYEQDRSTSWIGFRCAMDRLGPRAGK